MPTTATKSRYPECDKMLAVRQDSQKIGEFLEWLETNTEYRFGNWIKRRHDDDLFVPARVNTEQLLAEYFGIDLDKVEKERAKLLAELRK